MQYIWQQRLRSCASITWAVLLCIAMLLPPVPVSAAEDPALICDRAAIRIAKESRVPLDVLRAITRTETGRGQTQGMQPWPWTVNMQGKGVWFDTVEQAKVYVFRHFKQGARSFDVGCFQINYKWHGHAFASIDQMFDPVLNARYAARFLTQLHRELGDWNKAVGAYHSRTHKYAQRYIRKYAKIRENLPDTARPAPKSTANSYPLLAGRAAGRGNGSLFPDVARTGVQLLSLAPGRGQ